MFQLKLPVEISTIIEISDPVYTFCEVMDSLDLRKYLAAKESGTKPSKRISPSDIALSAVLFPQDMESPIYITLSTLVSLDFSIRVSSHS